MTVKVLLVDDSLEILEALKLLYSLNSTFEVVGAVQSYERAWDVIEREKVDVVSIDIQLANENGLDLCERIHKANKDTFVVICSLIGDAVMMKIAEDRGANLFIPKPMSSSDLYTVLASFRQFQLTDTKTIDVDTVLARLLTL